MIPKEMQILVDQTDEDGQEFKSIILEAVSQKIDFKKS